VQVSESLPRMIVLTLRSFHTNHIHTSRLDLLTSFFPLFVRTASCGTPPAVLSVGSP
jgi:hypothetical protein